MLRGYRLDGMKAAVLATDGVDEVEFSRSCQALEQAGAKVYIISPQPGKLQAFTNDTRICSYEVDVPLAQAAPEDFDALLLPGGELNVTSLGENPQCINFIRRMDELNRPLAAICRAPELLVCAGIVEGRILTSHALYRDEIRQAGGRWLDLPVVHDRNWVSSRGPADLAIFAKTMVMLFHEFWRERQLEPV